MYTMTCECENSNCEHNYKACQERAVVRVHTIYGLFNMCRECAERMAKTKYCRYTEPLGASTEGCRECTVGTYR